MNRFKMLTVLLLSLSGGAAAQNGASVFSFDTAFPGLNPCTGETINFVGTVRFTFTNSRKENGTINTHLRGTGSLGNTYVSQGSYQGKFTTDSNGISTNTIQETSRVTSNGGAPNFLMNQRIVSSYDPATDMSSTFQKVSESCRG